MQTLFFIRAMRKLEFFSPEPCNDAPKILQERNLLEHDETSEKIDL
jgi:hypothetical protein